MKIRELIEQLSKFNPETEVGLDVESYARANPAVKKTAKFAIRASSEEDFDSYGVELWLSK